MTTSNAPKTRLTKNTGALQNVVEDCPTPGCFSTRDHLPPCLTKDNRRIPESPEPLTVANLETHLARVRSLLDKSGTRELLALLNRLEHAALQAGVGRTRLPFSLEGDAEVGREFEVKLTPWMTCKAEDLIVSPVTAHCFELVGFQVGKAFQGWNTDPIPLHLFSVAYAADESLATRMKWLTPVCPVGVRMILGFRRTHETLGTLPREPFHGLLWARSTE